MAIKEKIRNPEDFKYIYGTFPVEYVYTTGSPLELFFKNIREKGKLIGTKCEHCRMVYVPPTMFCERCFARLEKSVNVSDTGVLESFTTAHVDVDGKKISAPIVWGLIKLDGATTSIVHKLMCKPESAIIGMKVKANFKPRNKRTGSINDIEGFKPFK